MSEGFLEVQSLPVYEKLREKRAEMNALFSSEGYALWVELSAELVTAKKHLALYGAEPKIREEARLEALALEQFSKLPVYMATLLDDSAELASEIPPTTD